MYAVLPVCFLFKIYLTTRSAWNINCVWFLNESIYLVLSYMKILRKLIYRIILTNYS